MAAIMCGRFAFYSPTEAVARLFGTPPGADLPARYNIAPTQDAPVIRARASGGRELVALRWGLIPFWARDAKIGNRLINARAETVAAKPAFRQAFRKRRCLVLADGFYEWQKTADGKQPWFISLAGGGPCALAGLWESWRGDDAAPLETCSIITTRPNELMARLHDRMPAILLDAAVDRWLDPAADAAALTDLLAPIPDHRLAAAPVSRRVNSPANDGPELIEAVAG
jgi:putative SOS response-associated peptidase YedK